MSNLSREIRSRGHYEIVIRPEEYSQERIRYSDLLPTLQGCAVTLRGWPFPFIGSSNAIENLGDSIRQEEDWETHREIWRFYQSGQFAFVGGIAEDWGALASQTIPPRVPAGIPVLGCYDLVARCTEAYELATRLSNTQVGDAVMYISIRLGQLAGRQLYMENPMRALAREYKTQMPEYISENIIQRDDLLARPRELAIETAQQIIERFGFSVNSGILTGIQATYKT